MNADGTSSVPVFRVDDQWRVLLRDVEGFRSTVQEVAQPRIDHETSLISLAQDVSHDYDGDVEAPTSGENPSPESLRFISAEGLPDLSMVASSIPPTLLEYGNSKGGECTPLSSLGKRAIGRDESILRDLLLKRSRSKLKPVTRIGAIGNDEYIPVTSFPSREGEGSQRTDDVRDEYPSASYFPSLEGAGSSSAEEGLIL
jgi:hypothetical protein